jgi:hypothetical protein
MRTDRKPVIDQTRVCEGLLFATHRDRAMYIGLWNSQKPQWRKDNPHKWRRVEDVEREAALPAAPVESVVAESSGPNDQMSSHDVGKDGGEESDITFVDTPAGNSSAPYQPTSLRPPVNENVRSGSTHTELPPSAEAATRETNESETDITPLEETERKQGRAGRQRKKRKLSAKVSKARQKRMLAVLDYLREYPVLSHAASKVGIHRKTLEYWIKRSEAGDDGYDIESDGLMLRFHELVEFAIEEAHDKVFAVAWDIAKGVISEKYPDLYIRRPNGKMIRFLMELLRPKEFGKHPKIEVPQRTGVLVIGGPANKPEKECPAASIKVRKWKSISAMIRKTNA